MAIDYGWIAANGLWVVGLAAALAVAGFARFQHPGPLAHWRAGWIALVISQWITLAGLLISHAGLNWVGMVILWMAWTVIDRWVVEKR